jgi:hypothetical protein
MDCKTAQTWIFRRLDDEVSVSEAGQLDAHLLQCAACARELSILTIPRRISQVLPEVEVSPFFYSRLKARIQSETLADSTWSMILRLSRHLVPALGTLTLVVLLTFGYLQLRSPIPDLYQAFDSVFTSGDHQMVIAEQGEITDESILLALAEKQTAQ